MRNAKQYRTSKNTAKKAKLQSKSICDIKNQKFLQENGALLLNVSGFEWHQTFLILAISLACDLIFLIF